MNGTRLSETHSLAEKRQLQQDRKRIQKLERELRRKDKALAEAAALLVLSKKLNAFYGIDEEDL